ncbi:probable serine/threonine-protein kinase roco6 [Ruditapes philippinarum]|uniref:probable serine/threonine-protein kinase roco6 n=1 Tax=Ruditapes philippinarum TaxID=129788 RepID=UPI00295B4C8E|nr:probable serine/threonine-protein kinase roco6 [Ruditapes philippinarum]
MDKHSIELYKRALSEGKEAVYNIRVMVVGHYGVGKTTLTKRLLDEDVDINKRESTNGIDVHVKRCKVSLETGQWETVAKDQKVGTVCNRLLNLLKKTLTTEKEVVVIENESTVGAVNEEFEVVDEDTSIESNSQDITEKNEGAEVVCTEPEPKMKVTLTPLEVENVTNENFQPLQDTKEENILYHLKALIEEVQHSGSTDNLNMADVSIWDFAGQFVFYATHQVFLSRRAVYLLVTDVSKSMEDMVKDDECFQDSIGVKHWKISEFANFWLNSIHEFCGSSDESGPPVLLVGTRADKIKQLFPEKTKQMAIINNYFYELRSLFHKESISHLIEEDFPVDNTIKNGSIDLLKKKIVESAKAQSYWGEIIPAKWITLENSIAILKNEGSKVLHIDMLRRLNNTLPVPIETDEVLKLFLRFHHESGNILYYSDDNLGDTIVLDPQWLIDAFKSIITARMFCCKSRKIFRKFGKMF